MTANADVVVVGGGHNGLVAAAYLARAGLSTVVCERRGVIGGAAVSEHPFGPDYTVTSLSYVVSLLPPDLVRDLRLEQHGYRVYPQGPYFAPRADGRYLRLPHDPAQRHAEIAKFSAADADAYPGYEEHLAGIGRVLGPLLHQIPPRLGSRRPQDLLRQARLLTQPARRRRTRRGRHHAAAHRQHRRPAQGVLRERRDARPAVGVRGDRHLGRAAVSRDRLRDAAPSHRRDRGGRGRLGLPARRHGRGVGRAGPGRPDVRGAGQDRRRGGADPHQGRPGRRRHAGQRGVHRRAGGRHHRAPADLVPAAARPGGSARRVRRRHPRLAQPQRHREDQPGARPAAGLQQPSRARPVGLRRHDRAGGVARRHRDRVPAGRLGRAGHAAVRRHLHPQRLRRLAGTRREAHHVDVHPVGALRLRRRAADGRAWRPTPTGCWPGWRRSRPGSPARCCTGR